MNEIKTVQDVIEIIRAIHPVREKGAYAKGRTFAFEYVLSELSKLPPQIDRAGVEEGLKGLVKISAPSNYEQGFADGLRFVLKSPSTAATIERGLSDTDGPVSDLGSFAEEFEQIEAKDVKVGDFAVFQDIQYAVEEDVFSGGNDNLGLLIPIANQAERWVDISVMDALGANFLRRKPKPEPRVWEGEGFIADGHDNRRRVILEDFPVDSRIGATVRVRIEEVL